MIRHPISGFSWCPGYIPASSWPYEYINLSPMSFTPGHYHEQAWRYQSIEHGWKIVFFSNGAQTSQDQWVLENLPLDSFVQSKVNYGMSIWGWTSEVNRNRVSRIQHLLTRIACKKSDYINPQCNDLVTPNRMRKTRLCSVYSVLECNHGPAPHNKSDGVTIQSEIYGYHDDVIKWKHFPRNWPFVRKIHRSPVNFPHKGQWRGALMFSLIYAWINDWANNREAGDLRRQHGHYDVIVMMIKVLNKKNHVYNGALRKSRKEIFVLFWEFIME